MSPTLSSLWTMYWFLRAENERSLPDALTIVQILTSKGLLTMSTAQPQLLSILESLNDALSIGSDIFDDEEPIDEPTFSPVPHTICFPSVQEVHAPSASISKPRDTRQRSSNISVADALSSLILFPFRHGQVTERTTATPGTVTPPAAATRGSEDRLHRACCRKMINFGEIREILRRDPLSAARPATLRTNKTAYVPQKRSVENKRVKEPYRFALNLAIKYKAPSSVLHMLIEAAPEVLLQPDGAMREASLSILLRNRPSDTKTVDRMLLVRPRCAALRDRHSNTPLHIACSHGAPIDTVRHLCIMAEESSDWRNFHNQTALDVARRSSILNERVAEFLWEKQRSRQPL